MHLYTNKKSGYTYVCMCPVPLSVMCASCIVGQREDEAWGRLRRFFFDVAGAGLPPMTMASRTFAVTAAVHVMAWLMIRINREIIV